MNFVDTVTYSAENNERKLLFPVGGSKLLIPVGGSKLLNNKLAPFENDSSTVKKPKKWSYDISNNTFSYETEREKEKMSFFQTTIL